MLLYKQYMDVVRVRYRERKSENKVTIQTETDMNKLTYAYK